MRTFFACLSIKYCHCELRQGRFLRLFRCLKLALKWFVLARMGRIRRHIWELEWFIPHKNTGAVVNERSRLPLDIAESCNRYIFIRENRGSKFYYRKWSSGWGSHTQNLILHIVHPLSQICIFLLAINSLFGLILFSFVVKPIGVNGQKNWTTTLFSGQNIQLSSVQKPQNERHFFPATNQKLRYWTKQTILGKKGRFLRIMENFVSCRFWCFGRKACTVRPLVYRDARVFARTRRWNSVFSEEARQGEFHSRPTLVRKRVSHFPSRKRLNDV